MKRGLLLLVVLLPIVAGYARAQTPRTRRPADNAMTRTLSIIVRDPSGQPIPGALATIREGARAQRAGEDGVIRLDLRGDVRVPLFIEVWADGYKSHSEMFDEITRPVIEITLQRLQKEIPKSGTSIGVGELSGDARSKSTRLQEQARDALRAGDLPRAQELLLAALELSPSDPSVLNGLGVATMRQGKVDQASIWFEKSYKISQDRAFPAAHLGIIRWVQNNPDESYRYFDEAVSHGFSSPMTHYYLGILSIGKAEWKQAVEQLGLASPERFRYRNLFLGLAYRGMGRDRKAAANFREFVKRNQVGLINVRY